MKKITAVREGKGSLQAAQFDIDNDQEPERIVKSEVTEKADHYCGKEYEMDGKKQIAYYAPSYFALGSNDKLDLKLTRSLHFPNALHYFLYRNRTYALQWSQGDYKDKKGRWPGYLTLYEVRGVSTGAVFNKPICEIEYQTNAN